jgi:hypothetical protein
MNNLLFSIKKSNIESHAVHSYYNNLNKGFELLDKCCKNENFKKVNEIYNNFNDHSDLYNISGKNKNREFIKREIDKRNIRIQEILDKIFEKYKNNINIVNWLFGLDIKPSITKYLYIIEKSCADGSLDLIKLIYPLFSKYNKNELNIHNYNNLDRVCFTIAIEYGQLEVVYWLYEVIYIDDYNFINNIFISACSDPKNFKYKYLKAYNKLEIIKWLYSLDNKYDIHTNNDNIFITACGGGYLEIAKWIYSLDDKHEYINLAFNNACNTDNLEIAKWLYSLDNKLNIDDNVFINAIKYDRINMAKWLVSICDDYTIEIEIKEWVYHEEIKSYHIKNSLEELIKNKEYNKIIEKLKIQIKEFTINEEDKCCICFESNYNFLSSCNHCFCLDCFLMWKLIDIHNKCAYCKKDIEINKCSVLKVV